MKKITYSIISLAMQMFLFVGLVFAVEPLNADVEKMAVEYQKAGFPAEGLQPQIEMWNTAVSTGAVERNHYSNETSYNSVFMYPKGDRTHFFTSIVKDSKVSGFSTLITVVDNNCADYAKTLGKNVKFRILSQKEGSILMAPEGDKDRIIFSFVSLIPLSEKTCIAVKNQPLSIQ